MTRIVHVAAAVIFNSSKQVLIAKRPAHLHQGGLWEFPGGKVEAGESVEDALKRELHEEVGILPTQMRPLIQIRHDYPDKSVFLDVWRVDDFDGVAHGKEGQPVRWVDKAQLGQFEYPAANTPIIKAARLPAHYAITPESTTVSNVHDIVESIATKFPGAFLQLRAKQATADEFAELAKIAIAHAHKNGITMLLNAEPGLCETLSADGVHLTSKKLLSLSTRPFSKSKWVAASCHNENELRHAEKIDVDFAVLGPVLPTPSHPNAETLGWDKFSELARDCAIPVYALGGMTPQMLDTAFHHGAQGVAGISLFLRTKRVLQE